MLDAFCFAVADCDPQYLAEVDGNEANGHYHVRCRRKLPAMAASYVLLDLI